TGAHAGCNIQQPRSSRGGEYGGIYECYGNLSASGSQGSRPVPGNARNLGNNQEPPAGGICASSEHCAWPPASKQHTGSAGRIVPRAGKRKSPEQIFGAT